MFRYIHEPDGKTEGLQSEIPVLMNIHPPQVSPHPESVLASENPAGAHKGRAKLQTAMRRAWSASGLIIAASMLVPGTKGGARKKRGKRDSVLF